MGTLGYKAIDVDNHYYEPVDAFTRHLDKKFRRRGVQMFSDGKHTQAIIGDRVNRFIPNPTFDPIIEPGLPGSCCSAVRFPKASTRRR